MKVSVEVGHYYFKVLIDNLPHVVIERKQFIGYQAWFDCKTMCIIEYYTKTNKIKTEQDSKEKWLKILKALNESL